MREIALYWWLYVWALAMPLVTLWFARTRGQVIRSLLWMALALGWAHLLASFTENLPGPAALGMLALGIGIHFVGGALVAVLSVRARRSYSREMTIPVAAAHRITLRVLVPASLIVLVMAGWWIAWGAGLMLADHPVDGRAGVEEMVPARTEFDVPFEELDLVSFTTAPFELRGNVLGWGWDHHVGGLLVLTVTECGDPRVSSGDRVAVLVDSPDALSLEDVTRGDEVTLRVLFYDSPATLKAIPDDASRYAASQMPEAAFLELYADPDYRWDPTPARTLSGSTSWPSEMEMEGQPVIFLLLYTDDGMVPFTIPLDEEGPVVRRGDVVEPVGSDLGRSLIMEHTTASADAGLTGEVKQPSITVVLNSNDECVEIRVP